MEKLRTVKLFGNNHAYYLTVWDTFDVDSMGKSRLHYRLERPNGSVIFEGEDFFCSPLYAIDSDDCLRGVLSFLTLKPGDTDEDYFKNYTPDQMNFAENEAEDLQVYTIEDNDLVTFMEVTDG